MTKKDKGKPKKNPEALGISGFTLGIVSLAIIVMIIVTPFGGMLLATVGLVFCILQQKRKKTKLGKIGLTLNIIGLSLNIIWWIVLVKYIYPFVQQQLLQGQFPIS